MVFERYQASYDAWWQAELTKTLNTPFKACFMRFDAWLLRSGRVPCGSSVADELGEGLNDALD